MELPTFQTVNHPLTHREGIASGTFTENGLDTSGTVERRSVLCVRGDTAENDRVFEAPAGAGYNC